MRPIDADKLIDFIKFDEKVIAPEEHTAQDIVMMIQTAPTIAQPPNDPLTLDELREMDGEPVWVVELNGYPPHWGLVYWCRKNKKDIVYVTINNGASICAEAFMAAGGRIYRRKPEEEMTK